MDTFTGNITWAYFTGGHDAKLDILNMRYHISGLKMIDPPGLEETRSSQTDILVLWPLQAKDCQNNYYGYDDDPCKQKIVIKMIMVMMMTSKQADNYFIKARRIHISSVK